MAAPSKKVLVFGATGAIGKYLADSLLDAGFLQVGIFTSARTVTEKSQVIDGYKARGAEIIVGDVSQDSDVLAAYNNYDTVISAIGRTAIDKQLRLIRLAEASSSIIRFFPSEYGTDVAYDATSSSEKPSQQKIQVRALLESDVIKRLKYTYLVTGPFADMYVGIQTADPRAGHFDPVAREATLLGDGNGRISLTTRPDVGRLLVAALRNPQYCDNGAVKVNSFTTTPSEILQEMERETGAKWTVSYTPLEKLRELETEAWEQEKALATLYTLRRIWTEGRTLYEKRDNEAMGMEKMDTLQEVVHEAVSSAVQGGT